MTTPAEIRISQPPGRAVRLTVRGVDVAVPFGADPAEVGFGVVAAEARRSAVPVRAVLLDECEAVEWHVVVQPDGSVTDDVLPPVGMAGAAAPRLRRHPLRLAAGTALVALLVMAGVASAASGGRPMSSPGTAAPPTSAVAIEAIPAGPVAPASSAVSVPAAAARTSAPASAVAAPAAPAALAAPSTTARPTPAPRPAAPRPVAAPRTSTPAVPVASRTVIVAAPKAPAAPVPVKTVARTAPVAPVTSLSDASGRCLTSGLALAPCNQSAAQAWSVAGGRLRTGERCLAYGNGLTLVACDAPRTQGWVTSARTTTNTIGNCLEAVGGRAVLTQCGTGTALTLKQS